jgi:WD40 repeat protein
MGPASDVYSLGATLYCLLTGKAAFATGDVAEVLQQVQKGDFSPPRVVDTRVAPALQAICLKAMALTLQDRYASAQDLAEDLEHWLADEPVEAYPEPRRVRLARWARRHKPLVAGAAGLLLTTVVALSLGLVLLGQANSEIQGQRDQAQTNFIQAQQEHGQAIAHLYRSLVGEARAVRVARNSGYRGEAWKLLEQAINLETPDKDAGRLRLEAAACLGDFVGLEPTTWEHPAGARFAGVSLDPDGTLLALIMGSTSGGGGDRILLRDVATGRQVASLRAAGNYFTSVSFSADGRRLFAGSTRGAIRVWEAGADGTWVSGKSLRVPLQLGSFLTPSPVFPFFLTQCQFPQVYRLAASPDGRLLAGSFYALRSSGRIELPVWDLKNQLSAAGFQISEKQPASLVTLISPSFSSRGDVLATGYSGLGGDDEVLVWDTATRRLKVRLKLDLGQLNSIRFSPDDKCLACACTGGVVIYDMADYQRRLFVRGDYPYMVAFSPDSRLLAIPAWQFGTIRLWDVITNREVAVLRDPGWTRHIFFTPDGKRLITASSSAVRIWDLAGAAEKSRLSGHIGGVSGLAFSPNGKLLASAGKDETVRLWDAATGKVVRELRGFTGPPQNVSFSPDGRFLTTTEYEWGGVKVWDVQTGLIWPRPLLIWVAVTTPRVLALMASGS